MDAKKAKEILDKIVGQVFGYQNPLSLEQAMAKFAFDLRLPQQVFDSTTKEPTWAQSVNPTKFITMDNAMKYGEGKDAFMLEKRPVKTLQDIITVWAETNLTTTERQTDSIDVAESDNVYNSQMVYHSTDINFSKNVLFSDGATNCEFVAACQRSNASDFCIRIDDSKECSNSFNIIWAGKITNSYFIQDCYDLSDCMFCSHISSKQYCIANMQFEKEEYMKLKKEVVQWVLTP